MKCPHCQADNPWAEYAEKSEVPTCHHCLRPLLRNPADDSSRKAPGKSSGLGCFPTLAIFGGGPVLLWWIAKKYGLLSSPHTRFEFLGELIWLLVAAVLFASAFRARGRASLKQALVWGGIILILALGIGLWDQWAPWADKAASRLVPHRPSSKTEASMSFSKSMDGHFYVQAKVNGKNVRFLVDTGATSIVLTPDDAQRLGWRLDGLRFDRFSQTANGTVRGAGVRLSTFELGNLLLLDIPATVNEANMDQSLLGMAFFNRLEGFSFNKNTLTLFFDPQS